MTKFLDASGLNEYHKQTKAIIDSSIVDLQNSEMNIVDVIGTIAQNVELPSSIYNKLNSIIDDSVLVKLEIQPSSIFVGDSSALTFTSSSKKNASSIVIKNGSGTIIASGSGKNVNGTASINPNVEGILEFSATSVINGVEFSTKSCVNAVSKIYYGSGDTYTDATNVASIRLNPKGKYDVIVSTDDKYIFFVIPSSMSVKNVTINGMTIPMSTTNVSKEGIQYTVYKSKNQYESGSYEIIVD